MVKSLTNIIQKIVWGTALIASLGTTLGCPIDPCKPFPTESPTPIVSAQSTTPKPTKTPTPTQELKISGNLEDCENHGTGRYGTVAFYDTENTDGTYSNPIAIKSTGINKTQTDSNGHFSVTLDKLVGNDVNDKIYVRTIAGTEANNESYTRTIDLPANQNHDPITDSRGSPAVRVTLYDNPNKSYDNGLLDTEQERTDFVTHAGRGNFWSKTERESTGIQGFVNGNRDHGLKKPSFNNELPEDLQGIEISSNFSEGDQNNIETIIRNSGYTGANEINIVRGNNHYNPITQLPDIGWEVIIPISGEGPSTALWDMDANGYIDRVKVKLNTTAPEVTTHEAVWHGLMSCPGHTNGEYVVELFPSIGRYTGDAADYLETADIKLNSVINEPTYQGMESAQRIFGSWQ